MNRRATETLHLEYIPGLLNYCSPIFINNRKQMDRILTQERRGLSLTVAKLSRTRNSALYFESGLEYYEISVTRMTLKAFAKMLVHPTFIKAPIPILSQPFHELSAAPLLNSPIVWKAFKLPLFGDVEFPAFLCPANPDPLFIEEPPDSDHYREGLLSDKYGFSPGFDSVNRPSLSSDTHYSNPFVTLRKLNELIDLKIPRKKLNRKAYLHDWWKTRLLARIRMGILPLRHWAYIQFPKHHISPKCRQCSSIRRDNLNRPILGPIFDEDETLDHIFGGYCRNIDYSGLIPVYKLLGIEFPHLFTMFQHALLSL